MRKITILWSLFILSYYSGFSQGLNSHYLMGYSTGLFDTNVVSTRAIFQFDSVGYTLDSASFKMPFRAAQGNLSDENGNLIMVSNGCWIADATGDTMLNGGGLIPNSFTANWCDDFTGIPYPHAAIFLPFPGDSNRVVLLHQAGISTSNPFPDGIYYTVIDKTLNNGLGAVVNGQKNIHVSQPDLVPGMATCKHANGRDWWIVAFEYNSNLIYIYLLSPTGISLYGQQQLPITPIANLGGQKDFSPDGKKFANIYYEGTNGNIQNYIRIFDFDRCSGTFTNGLEISFNEPLGGVGIAFSSNSKTLYVTNFDKIYQLNIDTIDIAASMDTVAINDGYFSPVPPFQTNFWMTYRAANGKIYISSGNGVIDMHFINYPDSDGIACDVQQHAIRLPCYYFRGHVYHPNYYLGCDTTLGCPCLVNTGLTENGGHDFKTKLSPNPGRFGFDILYLLPQNKSGTLSVFDLQGREMHREKLPPWSTKQSISASNWAPGVYQIIIESGGERGVSKWVKY